MLAPLAREIVRRRLAIPRPTPQSRQFQRDVKQSKTFAKKAMQAFKRLIKTIKPIAEKIQAAHPGRAEIDHKRRRKAIIEELKTSRQMKNFLDNFIGDPAGSPKVPGWRKKMVYLVRDVFFKPGFRLKDAVESVGRHALQAYQVMEMAKAQAPLREVVPEDLLQFLPKNIVVEVDEKGNIAKITDRFENEFESLDKKIERMHLLVKRYNKIVQQVKRDLKSGDEVTRLAALVTAIVMETGIRPGQEGNYHIEVVNGENIRIETFGAVTLGPRDVRFVRDNFAELEFVGKQGTVNIAGIRDGDIIRILQQYVDKALKGGAKYIFVTESGQRFTYQDFVRYFKGSVLKGIRPTDFRKLKATEAVMEHLYEQQQVLHEKIRQFVAEETEDLKKRVVIEVTEAVNRAYESAQMALSHEDVGTTIGAYVNPQILLGFLSRGKIEKDLYAAILEADQTLAFDPQVFIDQAISAGAVQTISASVRQASLGDLLEKLEEKMEEEGVDVPD